MGRRSPKCNMCCT